jgi:hypothetical protein
MATWALGSDSETVVDGHTDTRSDGNGLGSLRTDPGAIVYGHPYTAHAMVQADWHIL